MMQKHRLSFSAFAWFWLLIGSRCPQVLSATYRLTYDPNMFDDQYIGCSDKLEKNIMPKVLQKEKTNKQFKEAWVNATDVWEEIKDNLDLPEGFEDEYGVALLIFTNQYPKGNPIYQQLNRNLTMAGASRKDYMEKFHFKALHFYLTRALQMLKPNCDVSYITYRGSKDSIHVPPLFKFGRFTSASLNYEEAQSFGNKSFFEITTCFGAKVADISFFPSEEEVLIPPTEKFLYLKKQDSVYILQSTGQMCSYFNCAYLGAEKREVAVCRSDANESEEETKEENEMEERLNVLEDQISHIHEYRDDDKVYVNELLTHLYDNLRERLEAQGEGLTKLVVSLLKKEKNIENLLSDYLNEQKDLTKLVVHLLKKEKQIENRLLDHQQVLISLKKDLIKQQGLTELINKILQILLDHHKLLASMQEEVGILQGILVLLITLLVIGGFTAICNHFGNWM